MENQIKCLHCGKSNYKKKGFRKTQNRGKIQKFYCFECHRYFTNDEGFYRMRNSEQKITSAIFQAEKSEIILGDIGNITKVTKPYLIGAENMF